MAMAQNADGYSYGVRSPTPESEPGPDDPSPASPTNQSSGSGPFITSLDIFNDYLLSPYHHMTFRHDLGTRKLLKDAIWENRNIFKDKVVMEVGCGRSAGWLSILAANSGASKVYAIEKSRIANKVAEIVQMNCMNAIIQVISGEVKDIQLPNNEKVDIIISKFWGASLFYDSILHEVLLARDKFLKPGGLMFPNKCSLFIFGIEDYEGKGEEIDRWNLVYGYDMSPMKELALEEITTYARLDKENVVTNEVPIIELDLKTVRTNQIFPSITGSFQLTAKEDAFIHGFGTYFKMEFSETVTNKKFELSTAPSTNLNPLPVPTSTTNISMFFVKDEIVINENEIINGTFGVHKLSSLHRQTEFKIESKFAGEKCQFEIDNTYHFLW